MRSSCCICVCVPVCPPNFPRFLCGPCHIKGKCAINFLRTFCFLFVGCGESDFTWYAGPYWIYYISPGMRDYVSIS
jgi:hypothetical protein